MPAPNQPFAASPRRDRNTALGAPAQPPRPYIDFTTSLRVRFHEVDSLGIVWHGHYVTYLEEGRRAFGREYGLDYTAFIEHRIAAPIVQVAIDYLAPARLPDVIEITTRFLKSESARLDFEYDLRRESDGTLLATGRSVQVFTTPEGELLFRWPSLLVERYQAWEPFWKQPAIATSS